MAITAEQTVRDVVRNNPGAVGVFEALGIDYCCGGNKPIGAACESKGLAVGEVLAELEEALRVPALRDDCHWLTCSLTELTDHIVATHHAYSRRELPLLRSLACKINHRHGGAHADYQRLEDLVTALETELNLHMLKEEEALFPMLRRMQANADAGNPLHSQLTETLLWPVRQMMQEHDDAGQILKAIRKVSHDFQAPENGCTTVQAFYAGLKRHEEDLHRHIHLENNVLFPRALEMARAWTA